MVRITDHPNITTAVFGHIGTDETKHIRPYFFKYLVYGFFFLQNIKVGGGKKNTKNFFYLI